jgi:MoxR-like ATPase
MTYLPEDDEVRVVTDTTGVQRPVIARVLSGPDILEFQQMVREVLVTEEIARYAVRVVATSRPGQPNTPEFVTKYVKWGAGLRASQSMILGAKARALMNGRHHVSIRDVQALAVPILRHRVVTNFYAESERISTDGIVARLLEHVPVPRSGM